MLAISSSINHWAPYIIESNNTVQVLTDSRPCVQAFDKLCRGEFSSSARVSSFLSTLSRFKVSLQHFSGSTNLPADFSSRNPPQCNEQNCQVCTFIQESSYSVVNKISVTDILEGRSPMPYISQTAWKSIQQDCSALRRTYSHLSQGTRPNKKATSIKDVKRYLRVATLSRDGLVVVKHQLPFAPSRNLVVVPRHILSSCKCTPY